jgi:hypothetical protein
MRYLSLYGNFIKSKILLENFTLDDLEMPMSNFLDDYNSNISNIQNFNLVVLKNHTDTLRHIYNLFRYDKNFEKLDETFFSNLEEIESDKLRKTPGYINQNIIFTSSDHHIDIHIQDKIYYEYLVDHIYSLIKEERIKYYPIVKVDFDGIKMFTETKEFKDFKESLKSIFYQTGLRPIGHAWYEDYLDEDDEEKIYHLFFTEELIFIDCDSDEEYKNLYKIFNFKEDQAGKEFFEIFI